jgi:integrase
VERPGLVRQQSGSGPQSGPGADAAVRFRALRQSRPIYTATLHQLRHRFGTAAYDVGHDLRVVQELMGHATPATTALYAAVASDSAVATVQALPAPGHLRVVSFPIHQNEV